MIRILFNLITPNYNKILLRELNSTPQIVHRSTRKGDYDMGKYILEALQELNKLEEMADDKSVIVVNGRFCPQSVRRFCPIIAGFNAGTYKVPACVL